VVCPVVKPIQKFKFIKDKTGQKSEEERDNNVISLLLAF
jgi:hypothetical protein